MTKHVTGQVVQIPRTAEDLLEVMAENIRKLERGERNPATANAITGSTAVMLRVAKLRLEYARLRGDMPDVPWLLAPKTERKNR